MVDATPSPIEAAFAEHYVSLCRLAFLMVGDRGRAEEIAMDVFAETLGRSTSIENVENYLRRGVANRCRNVRRFRVTEDARNRRSLDPTLVKAAPEPGDDDLTRAVAALPVKQRMTIVLTYYLDLPVTEVAEVMGCSAGTVKSQLFKARAPCGKR